MDNDFFKNSWAGSWTCKCCTRVNEFMWHCCRSCSAHKTQPHLTRTGLFIIAFCRSVVCRVVNEP